MNNIIRMYEGLKHVESFDDLVKVLALEYGMPKRKVYPDSLGPYGKCEMLSSDWVKHLYASMLRSRATVADIELKGEIISKAKMFYAILKAGAIKPLYLMTDEASKFINTVAFTERLDLQFFTCNFSHPLVLYSGESKVLFDDVLCIEIFYDNQENSLVCIVSCSDPQLPSREFYWSFPIEDLTGKFTPKMLAIDEHEPGESTCYMIKQGIIGSANELGAKFYDALLYAFKFVLLQQCQKQIIVVEPQYRKKNTNIKKQKQLFGTLNHQRISLTTEYRAAIKDQSNSDEVVVLDKEGKELRATKVRGFLRRQHYGPENSLIKTVYIDAHESHSWKKTGLRIVKVVK